MYIAGFDPGINAVGFAIIEVGESIHEKISLKMAKNYECISKKDLWSKKILDIMCALETDIEIFNLKWSLGYTEEPRIMGGTRGLSAAARNDVTHLGFSAGIFAYMTEAIVADENTFKAISISGWKGTLPDDTVWDRVTRLFPQKLDKFGNKLQTHNLDAIAIALCGYFGVDMRNNILWGV